MGSKHLHVYNMFTTASLLAMFFEDFFSRLSFFLFFLPLLNNNSNNKIGTGGEEVSGGKPVIVKNVKSVEAKYLDLANHYFVVFSHLFPLL